MKVTATQLRQNIYTILDQVAETGQPVEIERKGRKLRIVADVAPSKLSRIKKRNCFVGDVDSLIIDWSGEWSELRSMK